jgi:hypothetical protein
VSRQAVAKTYARGVRRLRVALRLEPARVRRTVRRTQPPPGWALLVDAWGRDVLRRARAAGYSVAELATRTGLSPATLRRCVREAA